MNVVYCHFRDDQAKKSKERTELLSILAKNPVDALEQYEWSSVEIFLSDNRLNSSPDPETRIWVWHATQFSRADQAFVVALDEIKWNEESKKTLFIILASGEAVPNDPRVSKAAKFANEKGFGGFSYLPVDLDSEDKTQLNESLKRIRGLFEDGKIPTFIEFEQAINPPADCWIQDTIERLVRCASFDSERHGRFAAKLLDRLQADAAAIGKLEEDECQVLAGFITHMVEFERCRRELSHTTLNHLRQRLRSAYNTKTNPNEFPLKNDRGCVRRLIEFVQPSNSEEPGLYAGSKSMHDTAGVISQSTAIQDVIAKIKGKAGRPRPFLNAQGLKNARDGWATLKSVLNEFPQYDEQGDQKWLGEITVAALESAVTLAETYQSTLARKNLYEGER